jgi:hypothetical protein
MHSIYWVPSRACNQRCPHCYNDSEPDAPGLSRDEVDACIANFPRADEVPVRMVMISGGEVLVWPELLFHTLRRLDEHFGAYTELTLQTNGDFLDATTLKRMLDHRVTGISIASNDRYHRRSTRERIAALAQLLESHGLRRKSGPDDPPDPDEAGWQPPERRVARYDVWGANDGNWIGPLWPRGRAQQAGLSRAGPGDDFCGNWSGAIGFLDYHDHERCQVNIQLSEVYPCCPMTCRPIGDVAREPLIAMLDRLAGNPVFQALNAGRPEKLGISYGLPEAHGIERTAVLGNHCLWCDEFFARHAPELLSGGGRTERGLVDLQVSAKSAARRSA